WSIPMALASAGLIFFFGVFACTRAEKFWGHDSGRMVIDEIAGMFLALSLCRISLWQVAAGFFLFRVLDIVKPPPARSAERLPAGWGVMTDDMVAGAYAALILWIISLWM
ncbi:MAG: phosphatidylglycerophosphatase A, partial [Gemmatimonadota bacterium]|nr:phosphatidylglycerophosphatase A [Gemmatimonadota bacterium]